MFRIFSMILIFSIFFTGCGAVKADVSTPRRSYIIANEHGWIEIEVKYNEIETISEEDEEEDDDEYEPVKPLCWFGLWINHEEFISEIIIPYGEKPPYNVDTGFRFPVPVGKLFVELAYSGCSGYSVVLDSEGKEEKVKNKLEITKTVEIKENMVTKLYFDGYELFDDGIFSNKKTTLDDIDERLKNIEKKLTEYGIE